MFLLCGPLPLCVSSSVTWGCLQGPVWGAGQPVGCCAEGGKAHWVRKDGHRAMWLQALGLSPPATGHGGLVGPATWGPRRVSLSLVTWALPGVERWCPVCHAAASALVWEGEFRGAAGTTWGPLGVPEADQVPEGRAGVLGLFPRGLFWFFVASRAPQGWHFTVYVACIGSLSLTLACGAPQTWARWAPTTGWA